MPTPSTGYARDTKASIKAIVAADRADKYLLFCAENNAWYRFDSASATSADNDSVLDPDDLAGGQWVKSGGQVDVGCKVYTTTSFTVSDGTIGFPSTAIPFPLEAYDTDGMHDTSVNNTRITINKTGKYHFTGSVQFSNFPSTTGERSLRLYKNGASTVGFITIPASQVVSTIVQLSMELSCTAGDYFELYPGQNSGGDLDLVSFGDEWEICFIARKVG